MTSTNPKKDPAPHSNFGRLLKRDMQPGLDKLIAKYMGVESAAVRVMSIRKRLEEKRAA
jgi:hypothetical protein